MSALVIPTYWIIFKAKWSGREVQDREPFEIKAANGKTSLERYELLTRQLADNPRFIQIDGRTFATDTIDRIEPVIPHQEPESQYDFASPYTEEERLNAQKRIAEIKRNHFKAGAKSIPEMIKEQVTN